MKRVHFYSLRADTEGGTPPGWASAGKVHIGQIKRFATLCQSTHDRESVTSIAFGVRIHLVKRRGHKHRTYE